MSKIHYFNSPIGCLGIVEYNGAITQVLFAGQRPVGVCIEEATLLLITAQKQLTEYFEGLRKEFDLPLSLDGTAFQTSVWAALREIPYGVTCSYSDIAAQIGRPRAVRAVGTANGRNSIPIIIPCHRVIGREGTLRGFGGGLEIKEFLLKLEREHV